DREFCPVRSVGHHALAGVLRGVESSIGSEHQAGGAAGIVLEERGFAGSRIELVYASGRGIAEKDVAVFIYGESLGGLEAFGGGFPIVRRVQKIGDVMALPGFAFAGGDWRRIAAPEPAQRVGEDRHAVSSAA